MTARMDFPELVERYPHDARAVVNGHPRMTRVWSINRNGYVTVYAPEYGKTNPVTVDVLPRDVHVSTARYAVVDHNNDILESHDSRTLAQIVAKDNGFDVVDLDSHED